MSGKTPGQAAFERYDAVAATYDFTPLPAWDRLSEERHAAWEAAAAAGAEAAHERIAELLATPAPELAAAMAETRRYRETLAQIRALAADWADTHGSNHERIQVRAVTAQAILSVIERAGLDG